MSMRRRGFLAAAGAAVAAGCSGVTPSTRPNGGTDGTSTGSPSTAEVSLLLNWKPSGLHVPYYAARARGFYEAEGLALDRIEAGQGSDFAAEQAGLGNTDFAVTSSDQVLNVNSRGLSPLSVGVVMQQSPVVVFSTRETFGGELTAADQLSGKTVGTGPGMVRTLTELYLERAGVRTEVELVETGYDTVQQLLAGNVDAAGGVFGDAIAAAAQGYRTDSVRVAETVPTYGHVLATDAAFAAENPETVQAFLRATARGAVWARRNVERGVDALVEANGALAESRTQQREKWLRMADEHVLSDTVREEAFGWSEPEPWQTTADALAAADSLGGEVDPGAVWTNDYLDRDSAYVGGYADRLPE